MYKYNIYVGMFDKDTKQQEVSMQGFLSTIRKIMRLFSIDNYTIIECNGHYKSDTMNVCEPSIIIEFITERNLYKNHFICLENNIQVLLNQESVLITKQQIEVL